MKIPAQPSMMCYNEPAKKAHSQAMRKFYRAAGKELPAFQFKTHFNPGGIAVWGETYAKLYRDGKPVVEAYDTPTGLLLVRQWDGRNSGRNCYVQTLSQFIELVNELAAKPFVRF